MGKLDKRGRDACHRAGQNMTVISRGHPDRRANTMHRAPIAQHAVFQRRQSLGSGPSGEDVAIKSVDHFDERSEA